MKLPASKTRAPMDRPVLARYQRVKAHILEQIQAGRLRPGERVPSEQELVASFGVSRMTANRALRELASDGVLVRQAGVGTFVADAQVRSHVMRVRNIADEIRDRGNLHRARVLELGTVPAAGEVAKGLQLERDTEVFHSLIVHHENGRPVQLEDRYVLVEAAPEYGGQDFSRITPNEYLSQVAPLQTAEHIVRADIPAPGIRRQLQMAVGEPCLVIRRRTWSGGRPVSLAQLYHPGSRYELVARFRPEESGADPTPENFNEAGEAAHDKT